MMGLLLNLDFFYFQCLSYTHLTIEYEHCDALFYENVMWLGSDDKTLLG